MMRLFIGFAALVLVYAATGRGNCAPAGLETPGGIEFVTAEPEEEIFEVEEVKFAPRGGDPAFYKFLSKNLNYPEEAKKNGIEGKVYVQFAVEKDGTLTDVKAIKGIGYGCDEEAVRVVKMSPKWQSLLSRGVVKKSSRIVVPVLFKLPEKMDED